MPDGSYQKAVLSSSVARGLGAAAGWMAAMGWSAHLERKPSSLAVHWQGMKTGEIEEIRARLLEHLPRLAAEKGLSLHAFDGGLELRPPGITKAQAVETIPTEMQDKALGAYLGDDLTDEDAFAAVKGRGLGVLVRQDLRETKADVWLRPPEELLDFLRRWEAVTS